MRILLSDYPPEVFSHERFSSGLDCSNIAGIYGNGAATINFDKGHLHGKWNKNSRPDFKGTIEANCKGKMRFPDHRVFTLEYDPKLKKYSGMEEQVETSGQKVLEKAKWKDLRSKQTNQQKLKKKTGLLSIKF